MGGQREIIVLHCDWIKQREKGQVSHTHTHTHTQYSRHTFPPRLRPSLSEHHPSNTTLISCNPFPSSAGLLQYSALPPLGFTSLHYAEINAPRPHLAAPDSRQHANLPITHAALKGPGGLWVDYEEVSEGTRASELKVIKKLQRTPLQTPSVWDHTVSGSMVGGARAHVRPTCDSSQIQCGYSFGLILSGCTHRLEPDEGVSKTGATT